jgi:hypothetical protein
MSHVQYKLIYEIFQDIPPPDSCESEDSDDSGFEDECNIDWKELIKDDSFLEMENSDFLCGSFQASGVLYDEETAEQQVALLCWIQS